MKKEPEPKLLSPNIFWWGGGLPREGAGAKKFGMSLETHGIQLFWRDIPGFCRDIPEAPEKFENNVWVQFLAPTKVGEIQKGTAGTSRHYTTVILGKVHLSQ